MFKSRKKKKKKKISVAKDIQELIFSQGNSLRDGVHSDTMK